MVVGGNELMDYYWMNLYDLLVNQVAGSLWIFLFLSIIVVAYISAKFRFPNIVFFLIIIIWVTLLATVMGAWLLVFVVFVVGFLWAWGLRKILGPY